MLSKEEVAFCAALAKQSIDNFFKFMSDSEPEKNGDIRNPDGTFAPGNSGGPGRPKGSLSIKDLVRQHLRENPEELRKFVKHFIDNNRELAWQMLEGRPHQATDVTSGGRPIPVLGGVTGNALPSDNGSTQDTGPEEAA